MGVIEQVGLAADDPVGCPLIGYDNLVTTSNITASTEAEGFPATNLANPATHLKWRAEASTDLLISLLHFDGSDGSVAISDSAPSFTPTWTAAGGGPAQLDTAQQKFGPSSLLLSTGNSPDDYIIGDGQARFAFGTEDFTIELWVRFASVGTTAVLYDSRPLATAGFYPTILLLAGGTIGYFTNSATRITGTTTILINTWYHVAVTRSNSVTKLFVNGTQEGSSFADTSVYLNGASRPIIGGNGDAPGTLSLNGWIDESRLLRFAAFTSNFTPPTSAYSVHPDQYITAAVNSATAISYVGIAGHNFGTVGTSVSLEINDGSGFVEVIAPSIPTNDGPIVFRFTPHSANSPALSSVRIKFAPNDFFTALEAAVIYVGELLVLERSIDIGSGHVPISYGRRSNIVNGMSETGNFLGRIVLGEYRQSKAEFKWFTSEFYRSDIDAFLAAAQEIPFFWAWSPEEYPLEVGYVWLTNDAEPEVDPVTRHIALELEMRGIA